MLNNTGMDILSYLLELLQQRKEVGVTDLGTFFKKKSPGRYDKETQSFLPPSYTLVFTSELKESGYLADFIAAKRNISTDSANYYIAQFVENIQQKLETEHEIELDNLGRLFFTEHAGLSFEPVNNINYGSEFYGLPQVSETISEEPKPLHVEPKASVEEPDEDIYDEIAEAPHTPVVSESKEITHPVIENIELDEVQDDLRKTLQNVTPKEEDVVPAPEFIKEQHQEHPNRFGHTPESEEHVNEKTPAPEFMKEQHEENPHRFGHTPESEVLAHEINQEIAAEAVDQPKKYIQLGDETTVDEPVTEAPEFIKAQHAEHPNRFGHDPIPEESIPDPKPVWPKVVTAVFLLLIIGAILYYTKPEWFNRQQPVVNQPVKTIDTAKVTIDSAKVNQDSVAKTDSILKASQVGAKTDTVKKAKPVSTAVAATQPVADHSPSRFYVIAISYKTEARALEYIAKMKKIGLDAEIVKMEGTRKKVSIANFSTKEEAEKQKDILQKKLNGKGFYIKQLKINTQP
ncbi:SPOR domain-containing protein [Pedobacter sp. BMA]|uniref:SPOR domain-containing protein n=1 Tax=Pedobacter sp. BMA TaxID=1663685 RepID=UPI00064B1D59|nr:SPOR domain-containing protein [Pedobacter sp. BMA]KLT65766.1 hypothetical protein AB669_11990 [Pedobacter sp. BMA]